MLQYCVPHNHNTVIMVHKSTNRSYRSVNHYQSLILLSSAYLCIFSLHDTMICIEIFLLTSVSLPFSELSVVGLALDLVD